MSQKIILKDVSLTGNPKQRMYKVVKLVNYSRIELMGELYGTNELKSFVKTLPSRVNYEVIARESV
jgi:hypothetical protein|tara:strand:+ start:243 stop:440 length:198 start_codon:yes stop_codon:yes gene_type:complete